MISRVMLLPIICRKLEQDDKAAAMMPLTMMTPSHVGTIFIAAQMNTFSVGAISALMVVIVDMMIWRNK